MQKVYLTIFKCNIIYKSTLIYSKTPLISVHKKYKYIA
jgi:hypothetical protein